MVTEKESLPFNIYYLNKFGLSETAVFIPNLSRNTRFKGTAESGFYASAGAYIETAINVGAQVELGLLEKNFGFEGIAVTFSGGHQSNAFEKYSLKYITVPVLLRISFLGKSMDNAGLYAVLGPDFNFNIAGTSVLYVQDTGSYNNQADYTNKTTDMAGVLVNLLFGFGGTVRLSPSVGLFSEARFAFGERDKVNPLPKFGDVNVSYWQYNAGLSIKLY